MERRDIIKYMASVVGCEVKVQVKDGTMFIKLIHSIDGELAQSVSKRINGRLVTDVQKELTDELFNKLIVPGRFNN
jgi:hypothetical protein